MDKDKAIEIAERELGEEEGKNIKKPRSSYMQGYNDMRDKAIPVLADKIMKVKEWKDKYIDLDKSLKAELRDPNGTIWECAGRLQKKNEELQHKLEEYGKELDMATGRYEHLNECGIKYEKQIAELQQKLARVLGLDWNSIILKAQDSYHSILKYQQGSLRRAIVLAVKQKIQEAVAKE